MHGITQSSRAFPLKYPWLDWLRFIAAFIVLVVHTRQSMLAAYSHLEESSKTFLVKIFYTVTLVSHEAVLIFFVISGFLVGGATIKNIANRNFDTKKYIIDRTTRIIPPLIGCIILTCIVSKLVGIPIIWTEIFGNLFLVHGILTPQYLDGNSVLWTLSFEWWFYVLVGALGFFSINRLGWIGLIVAFMAFSQLDTNYLICWIIGAVAFVYRANKSCFLLILGVLLCCVGGFFIEINRGTSIIDITLAQRFTPNMECSRIIFCSGFAILLQQIILYKPSRQLKRIEQIGTYLASFSYTLYLTHLPVLHFLKYTIGQPNYINLHSILIYILSMCCCIIISIIMYWLIERRTPFLRAVLSGREFR